MSIERIQDSFIKTLLFSDEGNFCMSLTIFDV